MGPRRAVQPEPRGGPPGALRAEDVDTISQIQIFVKVVEAGSFTAAARELGLPKSTASRQLARLEDRLGVRLLERNTRALRTTEVGQAYYERCVRIVSDLAEADAAVTQAQVVPQGTLRISAPLTFGYLYLGPLVAAFLEAHPRVTLQVVLSDRKVDLIEEGYDLVIRVGVLEDSSLIARRLGRMERVVAASPGYLARRGVPQRAEDLRAHDALLYSYTASTASWRLGPDRVIPVQGRLISNNGDVLRAAAVAGLGLVLAPRFVLDADLQAGRLVQVLGDCVTEEDGIWAIYPHHRHLSVKVRSFVDFAVAHLGSQAAWSPPEPGG